jgi:hypothetical protein
MCNCSATSCGIEACRMEDGLPYVKVSAGDLYHRISGGSDNGSTLEDGLHEATTVGIASVDVVPYLDWRRNYPRAAQDRPRFRVLEAFLCPTFDHCMSAVMMGFKLVSGVLWCENYDPDGDGWLPLRPGKVAGGHAVFGYKPSRRKGKYGIWHQNSWTERWGPKGGRCVFNEGMYDGPIGGWWAIRVVVTEADDTPAPKAIKLRGHKPRRKK